MSQAGAASGARRAIAVAAFLLFTGFLLEAGARVLAVAIRPSQCFSPLRCVDAFLRPDPLLSFYPKVRNAREAGGDADTVDVLLLGGSVLHDDWSPIGRLLADRIALATRRRVRVDNLADSSHTSRDSRLKYAQLEGREYDLVLFYHGINEVKFNNVPSEVFRRDYGHVPFYARVNVAVDDTWLPRLALPWGARQTQVVMATRLGLRPTLPDRPTREDLEEGLDIKTQASFRENLGAVIETANRRGDPLLVATFAIHLPRDYTRDAFRELGSDYAQHLAPVKLWGLPETIRSGVAAHNAVSRDLAAGADAVWLADVAASLPRERALFNDVCHLTVDGSLAFADIVLPHALEAVTAQRRTRPPLD
jgi:hypothetical protein